MRELLRKNIADLTPPYSCARNDFTGGEAEVYLDANENWQDFVKKADANRYPDPLSVAVRKKVEKVLGLPFTKTVLGNGSDELIDNLMRCFCEPGNDSILLMPPTYGAYKVFADINDVGVSTVPPLTPPSFGIDFPALSEFLQREKKNRSGEGRLKLLFICSPNNPPSGNAFPLDEVRQVCELFDGITVVDEATMISARRRVRSSCWTPILTWLCSGPSPNVGPSPVPGLVLRWLTRGGWYQSSEV